MEPKLTFLAPPTEESTDFPGMLCRLESGDEASLATALCGGCPPIITSAFPLQKLDVKSRLTGIAAKVWVTQTFANPYQETVEATYLFPLPDRAAVQRFVMAVGNRILQSQVRAKAHLAGAHPAALLEQQGDNVFQVRVSNIAPQETIKVEFSYVQSLETDGEGSLFRFPLVCPVASDEPECGSGPALSMTVQFDVAPVEMECSQRATKMKTDSEGRLRLELNLESERLDRDFILRHRYQGEHPQAALLASGEHFMVNLLPPTQPAPQTPRDVVFLIDRSGSMGGVKMESAKKAVKAFLEASLEQDRFALVAFDDQVESFKNAGLSNDFEAGSAWLDQLQARGGSKLRGAMAALLRIKPERGRRLCAVIVTDGQVGNENELLDMVLTSQYKPRIFTLGIDTCINEAFLRRLAEVGRGSCELVGPDQELQGALERLGRETRAAVVTDLRVIDQGLNLLPASLTTTPLPDLFSCSPIVFFGRRLGVGTGLELAGRLRDGQEWRAPLTSVNTESKAIPTLWAVERIRSLEDQMRLEPDRAEALKREILGLALRYGLVSSQTSRVLVDGEEVVGTAACSVARPRELPAGWSHSLFGVTDRVEVEETVKEVSAQDFEPLVRRQELSHDSPILRVARLILTEAVRTRASHIHIEPEARALRVRFRVDGVLHDVMSPPKHIADALFQHFYQLARLNPGEPWPQSGSARFEEHHLFVSSCPTTFGPKLVLEVHQAPTESLHLEPALVEALQGSGLIVVAGLSRSGYRETLHHCAGQLAHERANVVYWDEKAPAPPGVTPLVFDPRLGEIAMLKALAYQDVDALVVRPLDTQISDLIAVQPDLTVVGMTAPDSVTAYRRLQAGALPPGLVKLIIAQSRLRKLCEGCHGQGCDLCTMTGYLGQITLFEVLPVTPELERSALVRADLSPFCLETMACRAMDAVAKRLTTTEEVARVLGGTGQKFFNIPR